MLLHEQPDWPHFTWQDNLLSGPLGQLRLRYGRLQGRLDALGFPTQVQTTLASLTQDAQRSAEIEGERLELGQVRSSVARRLGLEIPDSVPSSREVDSMVDLAWDAIRRCTEPMTEERLLAWQASLFPTGRSGFSKIRTVAWRDDRTGPMQVVSGGLGRERVRFQAPDAARLPTEMSRFLEWFERESEVDPLLDAAIAHLWFITLHPFDDGNGRIARALTDLKLSRMDGGTVRFYSLSAGILAERKEYDRVLETTQGGGTEITPWLEWFVGCMDRSLERAEESIQVSLRRHAFWQRQAGTNLNDRQRRILMLLLDGLEGKLTSGKWAKIVGCSSDTALRDIQALLERGVLVRDEGGGRSTGYRLGEP